MQKKMLTGFRPTGKLHLGHLHGNISNMLDNQKKYDNYFFLVDWHALSTEYQDPVNIKKNLIECATELLALGIDPDLTHLYRQSDITAIPELSLYLSMITPLSWLERCPTYKEQIKELKAKDLSTLGFFSYPVLMAADILIVKSDIIPVGEDQLPHIEITREIARRFNHLYGECFNEPRELLSKSRRVPGIDGRKMSKSYGNAIFLSDDRETVKKKVRQMITDPQRIRKTDPGHPDICNVFEFYKIYDSGRISEIEKRCKKGEIGCTACKDEIAGMISDSLEGFQQRKAEILRDKKLVHNILEAGGKYVNEVASSVIADVRTRMGID